MPDQFLPSIPGYTLTVQLYVGSRTAVYQAIDQQDGNLVVIKVLRSHAPHVNELVRFRNQYIIAQNLAISNIVRPLALVPWHHGYALVMEDIGGIDLRNYVQTHGRLSIEQVMTIALQLADSLHHLSQHRVLHKDINPANILIHPDTHQIWLTDFSLASLLPKESQELQSPNALEGTLAYIAPEQTGRMNRGIDYRADFYSLGVTLYELLTGELPFQSNDPMELIHCHIAKVPVQLYEIPKPLSDIVLKLMEKNAEDRYQSALGLKHDLQRCLNQWHISRRIEVFELGQADRCDRFLIPEKLYGRETEVQTLLDAFDRIAQGSSELILVAGFSGIGKTAVVNEVHKPITRQKGYFIKGKFDQLNRNIPFSAFVQAFRSLMGQLLSESDIALAGWKAKILAAVGENGQVLTEVIPELEHIIGQQPAVSELSGSAAHNRFNLLFCKFIHVFTTLDHPLVIFLDDLQWVDPASLNLFKLLMDDASGYLLVLGAYRDNELFPAHPLMLALDDISKQGTTLNTLTLTPLRENDINHLIADSLQCSCELALPLSQLVYQRTQGNPFFATQFLQGLAEDGWITFNANIGYWQWELNQIRKLVPKDDVVRFMVGKLQKLPEATREVLKLAACIGNRFDLNTLAIICEQPNVDVANHLWPALQAGLIIPQTQMYYFNFEDKIENALENSVIEYYFLHDRVQQSAYSLIPESQKHTTHYRIGQMLLKETPLEAREDIIFKLLGQLNYGKTLIINQREHNQLAQLNLIACRKAKASAAYNAALDYCNIALDYLEIESWQNQYHLTRDLHLLGIELEYLNSNFERSRERADYALKYTQNLFDNVAICQLKVQSYIVQSQMLAAIETGMQGLELLGCSLLQVPDIDVCALELPELEAVRNLEELDDLKELTKIKFLASLITPVYVGKPELFSKVIFAIVQSSIDYGYSSISAVGYGWYALLVLIAGYIDEAYHAGQISLKLLERFPSRENECKVLFIFHNFIGCLKNHMKLSLAGLLQGARSGFDSGDVEYAAYCEMAYGAFLLSMGHNLIETKELQQPHYDLVKKLNLEFSTNFLGIWRQTGLNLLGASVDMTLLVGESFNEEDQLPKFQETNSFTLLFALHLNKAILFYLCEKYSDSLEQCNLALNYIGAEQGVTHLSLQKLYYSLSLLANYFNISDEINVLEIVDFNQQFLKMWATYAPMNFQHKYDLVEAEKCRILGQKLEAIELYDKAIVGAKENEYLHEEALANELVAKFYLDWGKEKVAASYMQDAYYAYVRWGGKAKTDDLEQRYPKLLQPVLQLRRPSFNPLETWAEMGVAKISKKSMSSSSSPNNEVLDFAAVLKAAQSLTKTICLDDLLQNLSRIILQISGGDSIILVLPAPPVNQLIPWKVTLVATLDDITICSEPLDHNPGVPVKLIQYVKNTRELLFADSLDIEIPVVDDYLRTQLPRSFLCAPLLSQDNLTGILYLQSSTTQDLIDPARLTTLNFLFSQVAIALHNSQLYQERQQAEESLQQSLVKLQDSNQELESFAYSVAHDLRAPLRAINGYTQVLREDYGDQVDEDSHEYFERIRINTIRMSELIDDLLHLSQISRFELRYTPVNLSTLARTCLNDLQASDPKHLTEITIAPDMIVEADSRLMQVVMQNLLDNAWKFSRDRTPAHIEVGILSPSDVQALSSPIYFVRDNGVGFDMAYVHKLFGIFQRLHGVEDFPGTGIGLVIVKRAIHHHGGRVWAEAVVHQGATVFFTIPTRVEDM